MIICLVWITKSVSDTVCETTVTTPSVNTMFTSCIKLMYVLGTDIISSVCLTVTQSASHNENIKTLSQFPHQETMWCHRVLGPVASKLSCKGPKRPSGWQQQIPGGCCSGVRSSHLEARDHSEFPHHGPWAVCTDAHTFWIVIVFFDLDDANHFVFSYPLRYFVSPCGYPSMGILGVEDCDISNFVNTCCLTGASTPAPVCRAAPLCSGTKPSVVIGYTAHK